MRVLVDMNLSPGWTAFLRAAGIEAVHWAEIADHGAADSRLMEWAVRNDCIILTADLDFSALLAGTRLSKPSVLQIRADLLTPGAIGPSVVAALDRLRAELEAGAIVTLDRHRMRLRVLPLNRTQP
ncbi:MAG TPA: DUF5615 family PIN-like protein [Micropepsaceae bacterium]|nr:DUF5615 family PIN-like protein [Micropepsaceae bacterium]